MKEIERGIDTDLDETRDPKVGSWSQSMAI